MVFKEKRYKANKVIENKPRNPKRVMSSWKTITFGCHGAMSWAPCSTKSIML